MNKFSYLTVEDLSDTKDKVTEVRRLKRLCKSLNDRIGEMRRVRLVVGMSSVMGNGMLQ